jgi:hypothetical protein
VQNVSGYALACMRTRARTYVNLELQY